MDSPIKNVCAPIGRIRVVIDTNIIIDYLRGHPAARQVLEGDRQPAISAITYAEVLAGVPRERFADLKQALRKFTLVSVDESVSEEAAVIRRDIRLKLPDALILATARILGTQLVTRDQRDFGALGRYVRIPYTI
jgi:predicted nucleic acid-binding protein